MFNEAIFNPAIFNTGAPVVVLTGFIPRGSVATVTAPELAASVTGPSLPEAVITAPGLPTAEVD